MRFLFIVFAIFLDSLASENTICEVFSNHGNADENESTYFKKRKRYGRLGLVRVFSRSKRKSVDLKGNLIDEVKM